MTATTLTPNEKAALTKRCRELETLLMRAGMHDKLRNLIWAAQALGSVEAQYAALAVWEELGPEEHERVAAHADFCDTPQERARKMETRRIESILQQEEETPVKRRGYRAKQWEKQVTAYRAELRHRRHPHLSLVWVNDTPKRIQMATESLARSRDEISDILGMLNED